MMTDDPLNWPQRCRICGQQLNSRSAVIDHNHVQSWMGAALHMSIESVTEAGVVSETPCLAALSHDSGSVTDKDENGIIAPHLIGSLGNEVANL